jgi:hypothetical protein
MEDNRIWAFEESLWTEGRENYQAKIDDEALMVLPKPPHVFAGQAAVDAVSDTPKWDSVEFSEQQVMRPQEGLIVIAYHAKASRADEAYEAHCTTTLRRLAHDEWQVVQHQQTPPLTSGLAVEAEG